MSRASSGTRKRAAASRWRRSVSAALHAAGYWRLLSRTIALALASSAPRDDEVDVLVEREERVHLGPARHGGEHAFGDLRERRESFHEDVEERRRGAGGLAPALEDRRVARLERQRPDLRDRVGARLEDDGENAEGACHFLENEAVVEERA